MSDRRPNPLVALTASDRNDAGTAAATPEFCPPPAADSERRQRLIRTIESQIVPRLLISLGTAYRHVARAGDATEPSTQDLAEFARLVAQADSDSESPLKPAPL